jgi:FKBP-type peptidyl-prolyl cis-trans isomerase FkpA
MQIKLTVTILYLVICILPSKTWSQNSTEITKQFQLNDSLKPTGLLQKINVTNILKFKNFFSGIKVDNVTLAIGITKKKKQVMMTFPSAASEEAKGINVASKEEGRFTVDVDWNLNETQQLYIATATDSAQNFTLYSGYFYLPTQNKWKLVGTCKAIGKWGFIKEAYTVQSKNTKNVVNQLTNEIWYQKNNGSFKSLDSTIQQLPVLAPFSNVDSTQQFKLDSIHIFNTLQLEKNNVVNNIEGVFYSILNQGNGNNINVTDTVTVRYKGYIFETNVVFDQTKEKPATFL